MSLAYWNGRLVPPERLKIDIADVGFTMGVTVTERLRTFAGKLFRVESHFARLRRSLEIVGLADRVDANELAWYAAQLVTRNIRELDRGHDLGVCAFVSPGCGGGTPPTVCIHTYPLPFSTWYRLYEQGQPLAIVNTRQVPVHCWPAELKCRSRIHYYLADQEARRADPQARALLLDQEGYVAEASTANVVAYFPGEGLVSPSLRNILPGVSLGMLEELARQLAIPFTYRDLSPEELPLAAEVMLCSTSPCVLPVSRIDGRAVTAGVPGPLFERLIGAWSVAVDVDIRAQARNLASGA